MADLTAVTTARQSQLAETHLTKKQGGGIFAPIVYCNSIALSNNLFLKGMSRTHKNLTAVTTVRQSQLVETHLTTKQGRGIVTPSIYCNSIALGNNLFLK
jgi:hypothetical protein